MVVGRMRYIIAQARGLAAGGSPGAEVRDSRMVACGDGDRGGSGDGDFPLESESLAEPGFTGGASGYGACALPATGPLDRCAILGPAHGETVFNGRVDFSPRVEDLGQRGSS